MVRSIGCNKSVELSSRIALTCGVIWPLKLSTITRSGLSSPNSYLCFSIHGLMTKSMYCNIVSLLDQCLTECVIPQSLGGDKDLSCPCI